MSNFEHRDNNHRNNFREDGSKTQLFIAKGKNDGMDAKALVEFVSAETNIDSSRISNVKVLDAFSFFAVSHEDADAILTHFQQKAGEGRPLVSKAKRKKPNDGFRDGGFRNGGGERRSFDRNDRPRRDFGDRNNRRDFNNHNDE